MFSRIISRLYPYLVEGSRTGFIMSVGDILAQTAVENRGYKDIDYTRTMKFGILGFVFIGPILRFWYTTLDRNIAPDQTRLQRALKKMMIDQVFMAPTLNLYVIFIFGIMNNESCNTIQNRIKIQYPHILKNNYMLWPAALTINFCTIPLQYQVVFTQVVAVFWNCFLSSSLYTKMFQY